MTEAEYISEFRSRWPRGPVCDVSLETIALFDEAVRAFPLSAHLWIMRGNLITLGPKGNPHSLDDALACYQRAIEIDPLCAKAWDEVGHHHDAILGDEAAARPYFCEAERLRGSHAS